MKIKQLPNYLLIIALSTFPLISQAEELLNTRQNVILTPFTGYRYDIYQWSIQDMNNNLTKLTWRSHVSEIGVKIKIVPQDNRFNFLGHVKYGFILSNSKNQDSDWDNIGEYERTFSATKGNTFDLSGAVGFSQVLENALVNYYLGMDYSNYRTKSYGLDYKINRIRDTNITTILGRTKSKSHLINKYCFDNYASWLGASINYPINNNLTISPTIKLYLFYLSSEADWVLRKDFKHEPSFTDKAKGIGASFDTELFYNYNNILGLKLNVGIKNFVMKGGVKKTFFSDDTHSSKELDQLSLFSFVLSAGIRYKF
jgi:hypothetical protein